MYDVAWKRALMTPMLCLTFYCINSAKKKNKKKQKAERERDRPSPIQLALLAPPILPADLPIRDVHARNRDARLLPVIGEIRGRRH